MRESDELRPGGGGRQVDEEVFGPRRRARVAFGQQPHLGGEPAVAPVVGRGHPQGHTLDRPAAPAAAVAPADGPPPRLRLGGLGHRVRPPARRQVWPGARAPQPAAPPVPEARPPQEHGLRRGNPHRIGEPQPMPHGPKQAGIAKLRIGQHAGAGEAAGAHLPEQGERLAPLRLQPDTPGKPRPIAGGVGQPRLGHIERGPQQVGAQPGPQRRGDRHLAIGDFPHGPTVLAGHPDRGRPWLGETRASEDHQPFAFGQHARRQRQTPSALHGASVMKCWNA